MHRERRAAIRQSLMVESGLFQFDLKALKWFHEILSLNHIFAGQMAPWKVVTVALSLCGFAAAVAGGDFYLESTKTGKKYGPFSFANGSTVTVGKVQFRIMTTPLTEEPRPVRNPEAEHAALATAMAWLKLIDSGKHEDSWDGVAGYMKKTVNKTHFLSSLKSIHEVFGRPLSRTIRSIRYTESVPSAPDGEYVVILFATEYERKKSAIETVIPALGADGVWRVSGYDVR